MLEKIDQCDVSSVALSLELERAVIDHSLDGDGSLYITDDGVPFWLSVNQERGFVWFRSHTMFRASTTPLQRLEISNKLNSSINLVTSFVKETRLCFDYSLNIRGGLLRENLIRCVRQFSRNIENGLREVDPEQIFLLSPGESDSTTD